MRLKVSELWAIYTAINDVLEYREKSMPMKDKETLYSARRKIRAELTKIDNYFLSPGVMFYDDIKTD